LPGSPPKGLHNLACIRDISAKNTIKEINFKKAINKKI
jgi:hypothetical protein